jgi:hypothetical protein
MLDEQGHGVEIDVDLALVPDLQGRLQLGGQSLNQAGKGIFHTMFLL